MPIIQYHKWGINTQLENTLSYLFAVNPIIIGTRYVNIAFRELFTEFFICLERNTFKMFKYH